MITCTCLKSDVRSQLKADPHQPSLTACNRCCEMYLEDAVGSPTADFIVPISAGYSFADLVSRHLGDGLSFGLVPNAPNMLVLQLNEKPVGEVFIIRGTSDGLVLIFPGNDTPWYQRVIHPDDLMIGFGMRVLMPVQKEKLVEASPAAGYTVWQLLCEGLKAGKALYKPRVLFRVA